MRQQSSVFGFGEAADDSGVLMKKYLLPGQLFATKVPHEITTVLGSCVAVCLWDPVLRAGGMNHFMLPAYSGSGEPSNRYGDIATRSLLARMDSLGSKRYNIRANIFGGGNVLGSSSAEKDLIGVKNALMAKEVLKAEGINIVNEHTGEMHGRKIIFNTGSGDVYINYIKPLQYKKG